MKNLIFEILSWDKYLDFKKKNNIPLKANIVRYLSKDEGRRVLLIGKHIEFFKSHWFDLEWIRKLKLKIF